MSLPTVRIIRPGLPRTVGTFQLSGELEMPAGRSGDALGVAIGTVTAWVQEKFPDPLPPESGAGESFSADLPGQEVRCVTLKDEGAWTLRLTQPDAPYPGQAAVAGRSWVTDVALQGVGDRVRVGIRVSCSSLPYARDEIRLVRPRLVVDLARELQLRVDRLLSPEPWRIGAPAELVEFHALLTSPERILPVYVLTQPSADRLGTHVDEFLLEQDTLARRSLGIAHVVTMPAAATFEWTKLVGKTWSVFFGAVRTYRPGLECTEDALADHPLIMPERVLAFRYRELTGEQAFTEFLIDQAHRHAATMQVDWRNLLFLEDATIRQAARARRQAADEAVRLELSADQETALIAKITHMESDLRVWQTMAEEAEQRELRSEEENRKLRAQLERLRFAFSERTGSSADVLIEFPEAYDEVESWVDEHLSGRLVLHPRARRALKEAAYQDVSLVARALLLLGGAYHAMRSGQPGANLKFEAELQELGLQCRRSIAAHRAREEGDAYFVRYPANSESDQFLEWHLTKGSGKDDQRQSELPPDDN